MADDYLTRNLPQWLRLVELDRGGERLAAIKSSSVYLGKTLSGRDVLDMTLLAHGRSHGKAFDHLSDSVRGQDPTFGCQADDLESAIAASAAVSALLQMESTAASIAAQGVLSAKWAGLSPAVAELPELALAASRRRSEVLRKRHELPKPIDKDFFEAPLEEITGFDARAAATYGVVQLLGTAAKEMGEKLQAIQRSHARVLASRLDAADEELELLWWAFSGYSELAKKKWIDLAPGETALLCGIEFGNKLAFEIELPSTEALLTRLLGPESKESVSVATAVEATASHLGSMKLPDGHPLLPILSSMSEHRALDGKPSWKGSVERWGIDPDQSAEELALACQAVRETSLMRNISDGE